MKHILAILTAITFATTALAADKIEGAFGLRLGDSFEPSGRRLVVEGVTDTEDAFEFVPKKPNPAFSTYVVFITPNTHRIYRILAISKPADSALANEQSNIIIALLHRKYGAGPFRGGQFTISQESRNVTVTIWSAGSQVSLRADYRDETLVTQASEERLDNKLKGANADGL